MTNKNLRFSFSSISFIIRLPLFFFFFFFFFFFCSDQKKHQRHQRERGGTAVEDHERGGGSDSWELDGQGVRRVKGTETRPIRVAGNATRQKLNSNSFHYTTLPSSPLLFHTTFPSLFFAELREQPRVDDGEGGLGRQRGRGRHPMDLRRRSLLLHRRHYYHW